MDKKDLEQVKEILHQTFDERDSLDHATHRKHHEYIDTLISDAKIRAGRYEAIKRQTIGWGIGGMLGAIGLALYNYFIVRHGS